VPDILGQSSDTTRPRLRNSLPASYPKQFVEIAAERGIAAERVLAGTPDASPVGSAVEQWEREQALSDPGPDNLLERVRAQLAPGPDGYADLERVAGRLFMSGRTLKRKLQERGTTFRALLDDARFRQAQHLLENRDLDIQQVAAALGYRDPACFTRAFRRWSGRTPSQARAECKAII
jgi:AraC-like DNA-binding protein